MNKRKKFFANKIHEELFILVSIAALAPATIATICLYYLIFNITAQQIGIPEAIAYNIIPASKKVIAILLFTTPLVIAAILVFTYKMTHKIIGPFDRIVKELDEHIKNNSSGLIHVRKNDKFYCLVNSINKLLERNK